MSSCAYVDELLVRKLKNLLDTSRASMWWTRLPSCRKSIVRHTNHLPEARLALYNLGF